MATTARNNRSKKVDQTGIDLASLPPWYLLTYSHGTDKRAVCSHLYIYGKTSVYGPDVTVAVEYDPKSDNTRCSPKLKIEYHDY